MSAIVSIILTALKVAEILMNYLNSQKMIEAGKDAEIAKVSAAILSKTKAGKAIMEKVNALSDTDVDAQLRELEPK